MITIPERLAELASATPGTAAIGVAEDRLDFEQVHARVLHLARTVRQLGLQPGERMGLWLQKGIEQAVLLLAGLEANAVVVPIHTSLTAEQVRQIVIDSEIRLLIVDPMRSGPLAALLPPSCRLLVSEGPSRATAASLEEAVGDDRSPRSRYSADPDANAVILYTAAGREPLLGVVLSHRDLALRGERTVERLELTAADRVSGVVCLNLAFGLDHLWATLTAGATLCPHGAIFASDVLEFIDRHRLTVLPLLQVTAERLFNPRLLSASAPYRLTSVRRVSVTGGVTRSVTLERLAKRFPEARIELLYGLSEAGTAASWSAEDELRFPGTLGSPVAGVELLLLEPDGERCPRGAEGEIVLRGSSVSRGYWNNPPATSTRFRRFEAFGASRLVSTGDHGRFDPESGRIVLTRRRDGTIKSHGHRISPLQVEREICRCDDVASAIAFGAPNAEIGEDIVVIYSTRSRRPVDERHLAGSVARRLPRFMQPRWYLHQSDLPTLEGTSGALRDEIVRTAARSLKAR